MTREKLKRHCLNQIESCERWARLSGQEPYGKIYEENKLILELLEQEPKTGHWIRELIRNEKGGCIGAKMICSECGNDNKHDEYMNYCPNCGCRMVEPQERSE